MLGRVWVTSLADKQAVLAAYLQECCISETEAAREAPQGVMRVWLQKATLQSQYTGFATLVSLRNSMNFLYLFLTLACTAVFVLAIKVDDHPEVLDAAVVEAALSSFCEDADDPQTLPGPWEHSIRQEHEKQAQIPQVSVTVKQERPECEEPEAKGIQELISIGELGAEIKTEPVEQEQNQLGPEEIIPVSARVTETPELRSQEMEEDQRTAIGETSEIEIESVKAEDTMHNTVKTEVCEQRGCLELVWGKKAAVVAGRREA